MNRDGTGREVFARGIRNSVGMDFNPATGELWFTDNQVDGMGDDIPPGETQPPDRAGPAFRLSLVRRRRHPHQRIQGHRAAGRHGPPGGRDRPRMRPTSA